MLMNIKSLREQKHLTQEELAQESGISIRTIQRIEAGQEPKGHTAKALMEALDLDITAFSKTPREDLNYSLIKIINISSVFVCVVPLLNIILPLTIMYYRKQFNNITKQILSLQILWTISSFLIFVLTASITNALSLNHRLPLWILIALIIINVILIFKNADSIHKNKKPYFKLNLI